MTIRKIKLLLTFSIGSVCAFAQVDEPIPFASFSEITVNFNLPQFRQLSNDGGIMIIDGGIRGIILYRENEETFRAYERNCPYRPSQACADVEVDISRIFLLDRCCGSHFNLSDGQPLRGPASWPLRRYRVHVNGSELTITDEVEN